ncbi:MAG: HIT domain-containing protein [Candidatus Gastranaerophilales bacterium]|nr:HIT domain-containing protein [Candidatus Gastranaerophilales bacterium]
MQKEDCIFCKIANSIIPCEFVYETDTLVAFNDINPQAPAHILIVPKDHYEDLNEVSSETLLAQLLLAAKEVAKIKNLQEGYRTIINTGKQSGQEVFHIHVHVLAGKKLGALG